MIGMIENPKKKKKTTRRRRTSTPKRKTTTRRKVARRRTTTKKPTTRRRTTPMAKRRRKYTRVKSYRRRRNPKLGINLNDLSFNLIGLLLVTQINDIHRMIFPSGYQESLTNGQEQDYTVWQIGVIAGIYFLGDMIGLKAREKEAMLNGALLGMANIFVEKTLKAPTTGAFLPRMNGMQRVSRHSAIGAKTSAFLPRMNGFISDKYNLGKNSAHPAEQIINWN